LEKDGKDVAEQDNEEKTELVRSTGGNVSGIVARINCQPVLANRWTASLE
jgi:sulfur carrier protein ThiS